MLGNQVFLNSQIKQKEEYSVQDFQYRLFLLQSFLRNEGVECFLVLNGSFGESSEESIKLTNWLLKGASGHSLHYNVVEDPRFEESMIFVKQDGLCVYLEPRAMNCVREMLITVPNCTIFVPNKQELANR